MAKDEKEHKDHANMKIAREWLRGFSGTPLSQDTAAYNQVHAALPALAAALSTEGGIAAWFGDNCQHGALALNTAAQETVRAGLEKLKPAATVGKPQEPVKAPQETTKP